MKATTQLINEFLSAKEIAIAGVSRNKTKFGYNAFKLFRSKGYDVYPINPNANEIDDVLCYQSVKDIPTVVKNLLVVTPSNQTESIIKDSLSLGFTHIWIQKQSETPESIALIENSNMKLIKNSCVFMFLDPKGGHAFHRFIYTLLNKI